MQAGLREGTGAHGIEAVEMWLFKQLNEIAPGKYVTAGYLERVKPSLRFVCDHLKGRHGAKGPVWAKDYNLSMFRYVTGVIEIKCLYGCGLKVTSADADKSGFNELRNLMNSSTNTVASSEYFAHRKDPGPIPTYTDADRAAIQERERARQERMANMTPEERAQWAEEERKSEEQLNKWHGPLKFPEAPESIIERKIKLIGARAKAVKSAKIVFQDEGVPALEPVSTNTKIRKARKTQSRKSRKK